MLQYISILRILKYFLYTQIFFYTNILTAKSFLFFAFQQVELLNSHHYFISKDMIGGIGLIHIKKILVF